MCIHLQVLLQLTVLHNFKFGVEPIPFLSALDIIHSFCCVFLALCYRIYQPYNLVGLYLIHRHLSSMIDYERVNFPDTDLAVVVMPITTVN